MSKLATAISNLKQRLDEDGFLWIQQEDGYLEKAKVQLNAPATEKEIERFPLNFPQIMKSF